MLSAFYGYKCGCTEADKVVCWRFSYIMFSVILFRSLHYVYMYFSYVKCHQARLKLVDGNAGLNGQL